jgi:hypothetical protein
MSEYELFISFHVVHTKFSWVGSKMLVTGYLLLQQNLVSNKYLCIMEVHSLVRKTISSKVMLNCWVKNNMIPTKMASCKA